MGFVRVLRGAVAGQKLVLPTVLFASDFRANFVVYWLFLARRVLAFNGLAGFLSTSLCFQFLLVLENGIGVLIYLLSYICGVIYISNARTS